MIDRARIGQTIGQEKRKRMEKEKKNNRKYRGKGDKEGKVSKVRYFHQLVGLMMEEKREKGTKIGKRGLAKRKKSGQTGTRRDFLINTRNRRKSFENAPTKEARYPRRCQRRRMHL